MIKLSFFEASDRSGSAATRLGYEKAVDLFIYEGNSYWQRYSAMLVAQSVCVAALTQMVVQDDFSSNAAVKLIAASLAAAGLLLCFVWYATAQRAYAYYKYWVESAKELESRLPGVVTLQRGALFADGKSHSFMVRGECREGVSLSGVANFRIGALSHAAILGFSLVYLLTLGALAHDLWTS